MTPNGVLKYFKKMALIILLTGFLSPAGSRAATLTMLVYGPTSGGYAETTPGYTVTVWTAAQWAAATTTAQFAAFNVIVFGDAPSPYCFTDPTVWDAAIANESVWSPAITGNVLIIGSDPDFHTFNNGVPTSVIQNFVNFAGTGTGTGLYAALSCVYEGSAANTPVSLLAGLGTFTVEGAGGFSDAAHKVAVHPALNGVTDALLSNWHYSVHEGFDSWPANYLPLAIATDATNKNFIAPDGTSGMVYILAAGSQVKPIPTNTPVLTPTPSPTNTPTSTPTSTYTPCGYPGNTCTPTLTPTFTSVPDPVDIFKIDKNVLDLGRNKAVSIFVQYNRFPGEYSLRIYNTAGEHIRDLDKRSMSSPVSQAYEWDGTNKNGDACASGVYILYLVEPYSRKVKRMILIR